MSTRNFFMAGNWKLNKTVAESVALARGVADGTASLSGVDVGLSPVATALHPVITALAGSDYTALPSTTITFAGGDNTPQTVSVSMSLSGSLAQASQTSPSVSLSASS